jgi:hypothetical protein
MEEAIPHSFRLEDQESRDYRRADESEKRKCLAGSERNAVAAQTLGFELVVREASSERDIVAAFASFDRSRSGAPFLLADGWK